MESLYYKPRKVHKVDVGSMSIKEVHKFMDDLQVKTGLYDVDNEKPIPLSDLSETTQILLKYKLKVDNNPDMGWDSKLFFRLWRFTFRELQRKHGFKDDISEYDKFVKTKDPIRIEGNYVWIDDSTDTKIKKKVKSIHNIVKTKSKKEKKRTSWDMLKDAIDESKELQEKAMERMYEGEHSYSYKRHSHTELRHQYNRAVQRWTRLIKLDEDKDLLQHYMGSQITDPHIIEGMTKTLMVWSDQLSRTQFKRAWEVLRVINNCGKDNKKFWNSEWGWIHNVQPMSYSYVPSGKTSPSHTVAREGRVGTLVCYSHSTPQKYNWNYSAEMWESVLQNPSEIKFTLGRIPRESYNPFQEYLFRQIYYYGRKNTEPELLLQIPIDLSESVDINKFPTPEALSEYEKDQIRQYKHKLRTITEMDKMKSDLFR